MVTSQMKAIAGFLALCISLANLSPLCTRLPVIP